MRFKASGFRGMVLYGLALRAILGRFCGWCRWSYWLIHRVSIPFSKFHAIEAFAWRGNDHARPRQKDPRLFWQIFLHECGPKGGPPDALCRRAEKRRGVFPGRSLRDSGASGDGLLSILCGVGVGVGCWQVNGWIGSVNDITMLVSAIR